MGAEGPDPSTTRPPVEGGRSRFGAGLPEPGDQPRPRPPSESAEPAIWNPIPSFQPTPSAAEWPYPTAGQSVVPTAARILVPPTADLGPTRRRQRLPATPVAYPQLLRGPTRAWWRPLLTLVLFVALAGILSVLPWLVAMAYALIAGVEDVDLWLDDQLADGAVMDPGGYLYLNLALIVLIPAAMLSIWAVHRIRPRFLSSVAGGLRWRWLLRCVLVLAPLWAVYLTVSTITDPPQSPRPDQWAVLLVIGVLLTPWQAAAEEYVFRGWLTLNLGAYFARPLLAFAVPAAVVAAAFAAAHGSPDPWILADLAVFSVVASIMTWRTGGLEAAIVLHAINNVGIDIIVNTIGGFEEAFVGAETRGTPSSFAVSLLVHAVALALIWWQARRTGLDRLHRPSGMSATRARPA